MAILFDWYENPKTSEQQGEENMLHPRLRLNGKVSTAQLRARIQKYCTLTETDVIAVLDALSHAMGEELAEGRQVHLDGIGFFRPNLVSTEPVTEKTKRKNTKVRLKGIVYRCWSLFSHLLILFFIALVMMEKLPYRRFRNSSSKERPILIQGCPHPIMR